MKLELAPAAVVRASAWPIATLDAFGDRDLLARSSKAAFKDVYEKALERERRELWQRTAGDPRFMRALAFSSPSLFERAEQLASRGQRNKRMRHAETSLYRYLARAATRTTPNGLWAGVALAQFGATEKIDPALPEYAITPDLTPFAAGLAELVRRPSYLAAARLVINPSLRRVASGKVSFVAPPVRGQSVTRLVEAPPSLLDGLESLAARGAGTLAELAAESGAGTAILSQLWQAGALVGGIALPTRFTSAWEALQAAGDQLLGADRATFSRGVAELSALARELRDALDAAPPAQVLGLLGRGREIVAASLRGLGVEVGLPALALRCDLRLPYAVTLGAERRARLARALSAYQSSWLDGASPLSAARRARRRAMIAALGAAPLALGEPAPELPVPASDTTWQKLWDAARAGAAPVLTLPEPSASGEASLQSPWGCLFARLDADAVSTLFGIDDNPIRPFSRFGALLGAGNRLERWVRGELERLAADHGVFTGDVAVPFDGNPNMLACPEFGAVRLEPWGETGSALRKARLGAESGAIALEVPEIGRMTVLSASSGAVLEHDQLGAWLAQAGFDEPVDPDFRAAALAAPAETGVMSYTPRVALSDGSAIRPRSTAITGAPLAELARADRAGRFAWWRNLAQRLGWPRRMALRVDGGQPFPVDAASPLAVEAALEGVGNARQLLVEEADASAWLAGHVADVALPFARTPHAFSALRPR